MMNSQPPRLRLSLPLQSVLFESQQVYSPPTTLLLQKHRWCSRTRPPVTHYIDIWRQRHGGTQMLMQSGCENISRATAQPPHPSLSPVAPPFSFNLSLFPFNYHNVTSATTGKVFPRVELTGKRALQRVSWRATLSLS